MFEKHKDGSPCVKNQIIENNWMRFCVSRLNAYWKVSFLQFLYLYKFLPIFFFFASILFALQDKRIVAQECQKLNDTHIYCCKGGYALLHQRLVKVRAQITWVESVDLVSPPPRYKMWKTACTKLDGQMTL